MNASKCTLLSSRFFSATEDFINCINESSFIYSLTPLILNNSAHCNLSKHSLSNINPFSDHVQCVPSSTDLTTSFLKALDSAKMISAPLQSIYLPKYTHSRPGTWHWEHMVVRMFFNVLECLGLGTRSTLLYECS